MKKMRIAIEITSLVSVSFVSGIQRVVREILTRMVSNRTNEDTEFLLIAYSMKTLSFYSIPARKFLDCYQMGTVDSAELASGPYFSFDTLGQGDVFFDIDSVWQNRIRRSFLLPILKKQGVTIAVHIYDIIPVLFPQYCDALTAVRFMDYLGAHLIDADLVIANTESTLRDVRALSLRMGIEPAKGVCVPLGSNFIRIGVSGSELDQVSPEALALKDARYLLMVGTIEPRKNHEFVLDAYEEVLREQGFTLVIAGRPGWNVDKLMLRIRDLKKTDEHFHFFESVNDETINYLYKNAFFTVFSTQYEGFGLPIIESFLHKTPVISSDIPVLREVGGALCDYYTLNDKDDLLRKLLYYKENPAAYSERRKDLDSFSPFSWNQSEDRMWDAIAGLRQTDEGDT